MGIKIFEKEARASSVFKDRSKLSIDYLPYHLPHREEEYKIMVHFFRSVLDNPGKANAKVLVRGRVGTGKTVLTRRFGTDLENIAQQKGINLRFVHVNCRENGSFFTLLRNVITAFEHSFPQRGFSPEELLRILMQMLDEKNAHLVLALDELEALIRKEGSDPLYSLTRIQENRPGAPQRLSLICIFREPDCEDAMKQIDKSTLSTLQSNIVYLKEYDSPQLRDILELRVKEAFKEYAVQPETVGLIADIAGEFGDARYAIELLERSGVFADAGQFREVLPSHVRKAKAELPPEIRKEYLQYTTLHEKLILLAIARYLERKELDYMTMGELKENYNVICEEYLEKPRAYTQFWKYVKGLSDSGMISTKMYEKGFRGKTTLIGLMIPADLLRKEIEHLVEVNKS